MTYIPVSIRRAVLVRDGFACVAPVVDPLSGQCYDAYGRPGFKVPVAHLELDHVGEGRMGKAAPTDLAHLATLCPGHHRGVGGKAGQIWATANRPLLRDYLRLKGAAVSVSVQLGLSEEVPAG